MNAAAARFASISGGRFRARRRSRRMTGALTKQEIVRRRRVAEATASASATTNATERGIEEPRVREVQGGGGGDGASGGVATYFEILVTRDGEEALLLQRILATHGGVFEQRRRMRREAIVVRRRRSRFRVRRGSGGKSRGRRQTLLRTAGRVPA